jgi:superfamily II DNA or RNA helicase
VFDTLGGSRTIARCEGDRLLLKPANQFDLIRRIIREEGFLPYLPHPVPAELRRKGKVNFHLRPHQQRDYERFLEVGAVSVFAYPQTGKSFLTLKAIADLIGPKLILAPRKSLVAQWRASNSTWNPRRRPKSRSSFTSR